MFVYWKPMLATSALAVLATGLAFSGSDLKPEEVLARHLDSIGTREAREQVKSRMVEGATTFRMLSGASSGGGDQGIHCKSEFVSEGQKARIMLTSKADRYRGEHFIWNGNRVGILSTYRSAFGEFLLSQDAPLREGLLGGVLNTTWPLLDLEGRKARLSSAELKTVDGRELIALRYKPKKGTDLSIVLYFDPQTFHHVMTVYSVTMVPGLAAVYPNPRAGPDIFGGDSEVRSARQNPSRYRIEERFSDFKAIRGLSLPSHYDLRFTEEHRAGYISSEEWEVTATRVVNNPDLDPRNFETH